jgi:hypothetical protein
LNFQGAYTGNALADLLLGLPTVTLLANNDNPQALRTASFNLFAQDDWRLHDRLTINAGLRYELNTAPVDAHDRMVVFDVDSASLVPVGQQGVPRAGITTDRLNFAPRVGVSWSMRRDGRLLLRGGYGIFYDSGTLIENSALYFNPPYFTLQVFVPGPSGPTGIGPVPLGRRIRASGLGQHAGARRSPPRTRTRAASVSKGASGRRRCPHGGWPRAACTWCASAT